MDIVLATLISRAAMALSVLLHYQSMLIARNILQGSGLSRRTGVIVGMAGLIGAGRTELVRAISGADPAVAGKLTLGPGVVAVSVTCFSGALCGAG